MYLLKKALHGLKQAQRAWHSRIDEHLMQAGFKKALVKLCSTSMVMRLILLLSHCVLINCWLYEVIMNLLTKFKKDMQQTFEMTDLGEMDYFLECKLSKRRERCLSAKKSTVWKRNSEWMNARA